MKITLGHLTSTLTSILKKNAPVRTNPIGAIKHSPYPGNLKNNGIREQVTTNGSSVSVGGAAAPYAQYTEYRSHNKGWMAKSNQEFLAICQKHGGRIE